MIINIILIMQNGFNNLIDTIKIVFFANMKETSILNNFLMLLFITIATFILNNDTCYEKIENLVKNVLDNENYSIFSSKKNSIILEGKRCIKINTFITKTDNLFSNRFSAFWYYISKNSLDNPTIKSLKEYANSQNIYDGYGDHINSKHHKKNFHDNDIENEFRNTDIFIIEQTKSFKISDDIYCKVNKSIIKGDEKIKSEIENITIELYSFTLSLNCLKKFLDNLYNDYSKEINRVRNNKKFIYTLLGSCNNNDNEMRSLWEECEFKSYRTFNNLFFDNKKLLLNKLNFFINNREWYDREGHPYTFGIGLHGPPGTGKTSIIKCIANKLNRHIIVIPLNKIKTQREFSQYFFEKYYNVNNNNKIDFDDKIIVFEDIDCMTDIVKKRELISKNYNNKDKDKDNDNDNDNDKKDENIEQINLNNIAQNKLLNKIAKKIDENHVDSLIVDIDKTNNDKITLSYILNIIDGIRETTGRILIITSNDYNSLDPALIRPGRIDISLEMKNASIDTIKEMFNHYYNDFIPEYLENQLKDYVISPAKIVNLRLENKKKDEFLSNLLKEF